MYVNNIVRYCHYILLENMEKIWKNHGKIMEFQNENLVATLLKASLSPPVGDRLRSFKRDRQTNKYSSNVLNIITNGYIL